MRTAKLHYWQRTASDTMDTAGKLETLTVPMRDALRIARAIEGIIGDSQERHAASLNLARAHGWEGSPQGHGVTIEYDSGRTRTVRQDRES